MKIVNLLIVTILSISSSWAQIDTLQTIAQRWVMDNAAYLQELAKSGASETSIAEERAALTTQTAIFIHFKADGTLETNQANGVDIKTNHWQYLPKEKAILIKDEESKLFIQTLTKNKMLVKSSANDKITFTFWVDESKIKK
jgi:hypothetical protein